MSDRWRLIAGHVPEDWLLILLACASVVALADALQELLRPALSLRLRARLGLFALRLLAITTLGLVIAELTIVEERVSPTGPQVIVLVDRSASMALADADDDADDGSDSRLARIERIRQLWGASADARKRWREAGLSVDVRSFAREQEPLTRADAETLELVADGDDSDLTGALVELSRAASAGEGRPLAAVVVLSDGLVASDPAAEAPLISAAEALDVPITTVSAGAPRIRDLAIRRANAGEFAFVENISEIDAEIVAHGYEGATVAIRLERDGQVIGETTSPAPADGVPLRLRFEVKPERIGHFVYTIAIAPMDGEATLANNRWSTVVKVLRDKVRVLHVAGRPDWDVRALRTLLSRDPNVELLSYYILRGADDSDREDPSAPLSLISFPTDQLFAEELGTFDLVVLHNFDALSHQVGRYLSDIARYVENGGALVVIGGDLGLANGDYKDGRLGAVLPVIVANPAGLERSPFRPQITQAGLRHPITAWLSDPRLDGWTKLPALDSFNRLRLRDDARGATSLLRHPDGAPLLAVAEPGRGRSIVLATGASWRLGFAPDLPLLDGARPYDLLWLGITRWLLRDGAAQRLSLEVAPPIVAPGETFDLRAAALSASYQPEPEVVVDWTIRPLFGAAAGANADNADDNDIDNADADDNDNADADDNDNDNANADDNADDDADADAEPRPAVASGSWVTDSLGRQTSRVGPLPPGAYEVLAHRRPPADDPDAPVASARRVLLVEAAHRELAEVDADPGEARLADLAARTGGDALRARDGDLLPATLELRPPRAGASADLRVERRREVPLWDGFAALTLLIVAFGGEWILRRRLGLT